MGRLSPNMNLKFFLNFGQYEPCDSYKLYSYKKLVTSESDSQEYLRSYTHIACIAGAGAPHMSDRILSDSPVVRNLSKVSSKSDHPIMYFLKLAIFSPFKLKKRPKMARKFRKFHSIMYFENMK